MAIVVRKSDDTLCHGFERRVSSATQAAHVRLVDVGDLVR